VPLSEYDASQRPGDGRRSPPDVELLSDFAKIHDDREEVELVGSNAPEAGHPREEVEDRPTVGATVKQDPCSGRAGERKLAGEAGEHGGRDGVDRVAPGSEHPSAGPGRLWMPRRNDTARRHEAGV